MVVSNRNILFQGSIFRVYVSLPGGYVESKEAGIIKVFFGLFDLLRATEVTRLRASVSIRLDAPGIIKRDPF